MESITDEELSTLRRDFDRCDRDADGRISAAEFQALLQSLDSDLSEDECLLAFTAVDEDGDGRIQFEEFMRWWTDE